MRTDVLMIKQAKNIYPYPYFYILCLTHNFYILKIMHLFSKNIRTFLNILKVYQTSYTRNKFLYPNKN